MPATKQRQDEQLFPTQSLDVLWVDAGQGLEVPADTLIFKAQKLQVILQKFDKLLENSPQQFSAQQYQAILNEYVSTCNQIKKASSNDDGDRMAREVPGSEDEASMGVRAPAGMVPRVSAQNPFTR